MGTISAVVAVLDMKFVMIQQSINTTKVSTYGEGFSPNSAHYRFCDHVTCSCLGSSADASERVPPNRKMVFKSMEFNACLLRDNSGNDQCQCAHTSGNVQLDADLLFKDHSQ